MTSDNYKPHIDCIKGIGIILVVIGHLNPALWLERWIYSLHMFLFFFLSGYLFHRKPKFTQQFITSTRVCLIPFLFWNLSAILISLIIQEYTIKDALIYLFWLGEKISWNSPVWFLFELWWVRLTAQVIFPVFPRIFTMLTCAVLGYFDILGFLPFGLSILPTALIFFLLGNETALKEDIFLTASPKFHSYFVIVVALLLNVFLASHNPRISVYGCYFGIYPIALIAGGGGVLWIYYIMRLWYKKGHRSLLLEFWGQQSFTVMCTHYFFLRGLSAISIRFFNGYDIWHEENIIKALLVSILIFSLQYCLICATKKLHIPSSVVLKI